MDNIKKILQFSMRMERQGENFYRYYAGRVNDVQTGKLFEQLADMEKGHYNILKEKFDALGGGREHQVISWVVDIKNYMKSQRYLLMKVAVDTADEDERISDLAIVRMAYLIEGLCTFLRTMPPPGWITRKSKTSLNLGGMGNRAHGDIP